MQTEQTLISPQNELHLNLLKQWLTDIACKKRLIVTLFTSPYLIQYIPKTAEIIVAYEDDQDALNAAADTLLGIHKPHGVLPIRDPRK